VAQLAKCPACGRLLRIPPDVAEATVTCPRCLADVPNPAWEGRGAPASRAVSAPAAAPGAPAARLEIESRPPSAERAPAQAASIDAEVFGIAPESQRRNCPGCGQSLKPDWRFCPYCEDEVRHAARRRAQPLDQDVRRDTKSAGCGLIGLAILGALGLASYVLPGFAYVASSGEVGPLVPAILGILFLGAIATGIMFARTRHNPSARGVGRVIFGTLVLAGVLFLVALAAGIVFFVVCLASFKGFH
jgi:hypothetical protein